LGKRWDLILKVGPGLGHVPEVDGRGIGNATGDLESTTILQENQHSFLFLDSNSMGSEHLHQDRPAVLL
jgi:hypothetical protein